MLRPPRAADLPAAPAMACGPTVSELIHVGVVPTMPVAGSIFVSDS
jgi:hypothetical protein